MSESNIHGVFSFFAFVCLIGLFLTAWQHVVIDAVRQRMFEIRDKAFLWAHDHARLDDEAYKEFREVSNVSIRMYENTSILRVLVINKIFNLDLKTKNVEFGFFADPHLKSEFYKLTKIFVIGLAARSLFASTVIICTLPVIALSLLLNGRPSVASGKFAHAITREVEADIRLAASA